MNEGNPLNNLIPLMEVLGVVYEGSLEPMDKYFRFPSKNGRHLGLHDDDVIKQNLSMDIRKG